MSKILFEYLSKIVSMVGKEVRVYLNGIFRMIHIYWKEQELRLPILKLIESISEALQDEFKVYLTDLIPVLLKVLQNKL